MNFKIYNFNIPSCKNDPERMESMQEYDGEYNYELKNEYFDNLWFKSNLDLNRLEFQIFLTKHEHFRLTELYINPEYIQSYYSQKYQTPFYYELSDSSLKAKYHPTFQLGKFLNFKDFEEVIKPQLKIHLTQGIDESNLKESKYYVINNWEFYSELQIGEDSNSLLRYIDRIPFGTKNSYDNKQEAQLRGINILLENASSTADTQLKGLNFQIYSKSNLFVQESYNDNFWLTPKKRNINIQTENLEAKQDLLNEYKTLFLNRDIKPFEIIDGR